MAKINWTKHNEKDRLKQLKDEEFLNKPYLVYATDKQKALLKKLKIDFEPYISVSGASALIDKALGMEKRATKEDMRSLLQDKKQEIENFLKNKKIKCD